ncbi:MAG: PadR family transcriptional regulator [Bacteroidales bacterium]|nr:PadR family transcriptional regulator [Clostridium sp.]MCM1203041.1 PadR family transcriptional regulator [Bacteroidales bacterium]
MGLRYEQQMKKGVLEILVLKLLAQEEKYGYQLISELRQQSEEMFTLKEGTLYPILYRLEDEGMVTYHWSIPKGKEVSKKYYSITDKGRETLTAAIQLWKEFSSHVNRILEQENCPASCERGKGE